MLCRPSAQRFPSPSQDCKRMSFPTQCVLSFYFYCFGGGAEGHFPPLGIHYATLKTDTSTPTQAVEWGNKLRGLECRRKLHS